MSKVYPIAHDITIVLNSYDTCNFLIFLASNGVVLATEKKQKSILYDENSIHKIEMITKNVGMVYSGMGPDYRYGKSNCLNTCYTL